MNFLAFSLPLFIPLFYAVVQLLRDPMDYNTPGFPVLHHLLEFVQIHLRFICSDSFQILLSQWCHPIISSSVTSFSSCPQHFPVSGSLPMSRLFLSGGESIGASALASILPVNIQGWYPLRLTGFTYMLSKGLLFDCFPPYIYQYIYLVFCAMF